MYCAADAELPMGARLPTMAAVLERLMPEVSLRGACAIRRACKPTWLTPTAPWARARGHSTVTYGLTATSTSPGTSLTLW